MIHGLFVSDNQSWVDVRRGPGTALLAEWSEFWPATQSAGSFSLPGYSAERDDTMALPERLHRERFRDAYHRAARRTIRAGNGLGERILIFEYEERSSNLKNRAKPITAAG